MYNAPCYYFPPSPTFANSAPPQPSVFIALFYALSLLLSKFASEKQRKAKQKKYFIKHTVIFRGLATPLRPPPRRCMNECAKERAEVRAREQEWGNYVCRWVYYLIAIGNGGARKKFSAKSDISVACFRKQVQERERERQRRSGRGALTLVMLSCRVWGSARAIERERERRQQPLAVLLCALRFECFFWAAAKKYVTEKFTANFNLHMARVQSCHFACRSLSLALTLSHCLSLCFN